MAFLTRRMRTAGAALCACLAAALPVHAQDGAPFEDAVVDVGNVGLTVTNVAFVGRANVRNNPTGPPSFEYPLGSGIEHLFESGLWIGAVRNDGVVTVRTGATVNSGGYQPGQANYEFAPLTVLRERSSLPTSEAFTTAAVSHQDYLATAIDTFATLPGTFIPMPDPQGALGAEVHFTSYAWNFPFAEYFVILNYDIVNVSPAAWDSVYVGLYHDLVVRNVNTTNDAGGAFFNKGGFGYIDSLTTMYAFNAGGTEESLNTYGAVTFLGAEWEDPRTGQRRFFHPAVADQYRAEGRTPPTVNPRWWLFSSGTAELSRPTSDEERYRRMALGFPNPDDFDTQAELEDARAAWFERLQTDGQTSNGNFIGMTPIGPFPRVEPGDTLQVTFALVAALKPDAFQGLENRAVDTPESRRLLANNVQWARRTYAGEDNNFNGRLDPGEDVNGNGQLDRYLIPEPPASPRVRVELEAGRAILYWDDSAEQSRDPVTGLLDFEGYRIYQSRPGDDRTGNILAGAGLIAQFDREGNRTGFNNGLGAIRLPEPVTFPDDPTAYTYRFEVDGLLSGWQYLFTVTAFDEGDRDAGLDSFESALTAAATRVFPGTPPATAGDGRKVGVYPNPYRVSAAWDGTSSRTRRLNFYNLPARAEVRIYTLAGEIVAQFDHDAATYTGDIRWFDDFAAGDRRLPGGEHAWDLLSENGLRLTTGLYLFTVKDLDSGDVQRGKFSLIK
ncbi:MAG: hypothetical protein R3247_00295 [Rhodothermales bacterium]|nr:hypothetical protein [Rhodothermales bacterium]